MKKIENFKKNTRSLSLSIVKQWIASFLAMTKRKMIMTTLFVIAIILLANIAIETKETNAGRQPLDFLNQDFWNSNPDDGNIKTALFGNGNPNSSAYNRFWTGGCTITEIVYVNNLTIPSTIEPNKIYVLNSGNYNIPSPIVMANCSALVGSGKVTMKKQIGTNTTILIGNKNIILDNLRINGNNVGTSPGILLNTASQNTINNVETRNSKIGILIENSNNNMLNKIKSHDNVNFGIQLLGSNNNYISNSQVYNNNDGIQIAGKDGVGASTGASSNNNVLNNLLVFNNNRYGIYLIAGNGGKGEINLGNIQGQGNIAGKKGGDVSYNIIINSQIFKNNEGINGKFGKTICGLTAGTQVTTGGNGGNLLRNIFENNILNSNNLGISMLDDLRTTAACHGSATHGADGVFSGQIIKDSYIYNSDTAFLLYSNPTLPIKGEGSIYVFDNTLITGSISVPSSQNLQGYIGQTLSGTHTLHTNTGNTSYHRLTNAVNSSGQKLLNGTNWTAMRGTSVFLASEPNKYIFGKKIPKQIKPVRYNSSGDLEPFGAEGLDRDPDKYIAAVDMELNTVDETIVNYYYGPDREFITNRSGNNCSLGAFTVEYINNQTDFNNKLLSSNPGILGHTIYVLNNLTYDMTGASQISINDNCVAIVNQGSGVTIKRGGTSQNPLIQVNGQENIILNNLNLDGNSTSNHGILLEKVGSQSSNNNTINNVKSYSHRMNGIMLGVSASYNTIMNTQTWNNTENGIEIYLGGNYNIINNSLSYNNDRYGIRFGNISKFNTINNSQFFNNGIGGIFADFTTEQNIINNVHAYNNAVYGLNFKRSSGNNLNEVYSYNNKIGINITDTSCVNNKFNNDLFVFGNSQANLTGTNGEDNFLSSNGPNGTLSRYGGILQTGDDSMNCSWATNPRYTYLNNISWLLDESSSCANTGKQTSWNPIYSNNIDYMFGLGVSKQIEPIGYVDGEISNLNNQYNPNAYIGEVNPIIWTNPGVIDILSGTNTNLQLNTEHEMDVIYSTGNINHNFNVFLTLHPSNTNGHIKIKTGGVWNNVGTQISGVNFLDVEGIKIVVTTPNNYYKNVSGTIYIGTSQYGNNTGNFSIRTIADQTPPSITWSGNIYPGGLWYGQSNIWQAIINGVYNTTSWASYVTGADDCNTGLALTTPIYNGASQNIVSNTAYNTLNDKYVCIVAKDDVNNQYTTGISNQIKISKVEFVDNIALGPVYYDIIDINFQNVQNYGYRRVNTGSECGTGLSGLSFINYNGPILINDISLNGKYLCAYAQDISGSGKYLLSSNKLNIVDYSNTVNFIDNVSENWVSSDIVSVYFSSAVQFSDKKYKRVEEVADCSNTLGMIDYTGAIMIDHQGLNGKHFCLYSREQLNGVVNYLISNHKLKIDSTNPTDAAIISPISGQNIYWLIIKTLGASDGESGLAGFEYEIAENSTFLDVIGSGIAYTIGNEFSPIFSGSESNYAIRIRAIDNVGNKSDRSNTVDINYKNLANFEFQDVNNAQILTSHTSNEITMGGLGINETIKASITNGTLYRNGNALGTSGLVQNNDKLSIKMISSENYSGVVQTKLKIANRIIPWKITTAQTGIINTGTNSTGSVTGFNLTSTEMLSVEAIFNSIIAMYSNPTQLHSFLLVMKSMLQDNIALAGINNAESLRYLLYLIDQYIATHFNNQNSNVHKAPNCKEYNIVYNTGDNTYFSPNTVKQTKFGSRDELIKFLDSNNPGDCHINIYGNTISYNNTDPNRHIAPNGKVYSIQSGDIGFSSSEFLSIKYFANVSELRSYIDKNNPAIVVWDHQVDATFEPIVHSAPNGKDYKIYKTSRGYMSYKLLKVQYFGGLEELKAYINKNNK